MNDKSENKQQHQDEQIRKQVEKIGVFLEQESRASAITPLAGRLFAYLLLSDPPYRNFYEIEEFLQASKSSISTALRALTQVGMVDYFTMTGDRKRYFRVNTAKWLEFSKKRIHHSLRAITMAQEVLDFRKAHQKEDEEFNQGLEKVVNFHQYIKEGIQKLVENWEIQHKEFQR